jgi:hypothetical protein
MSKKKKKKNSYKKPLKKKNLIKKKWHQKKKKRQDPLARWVKFLFVSPPFSSSHLIPFYCSAQY